MNSLLKFPWPVISLPAAIFLICLTALPACSRQATPEKERRGASPNTKVPVGPKVVFLGDSIAAGLHLAADESFPARLAEKLLAAGYPIQLINAGVSGDTTAGGLRRLSWLLDQKPAVLVLELGGNDGLRAIPVPEVERNLREITKRAKAAGVRVLLLGQKLPDNYGEEYNRTFEAAYLRVATEEEIPFVPWFMQGVAGVDHLNLEDGIHPTAEGHQILADNVYPALLKVIQGLEPK